MNYIDVTDLVKPQQVLNFSFSTMMLFRCTKKRFAEEFRKGKIFFNKPKNWIQIEKDGNKGRGDILEGTFMSVKSNDTSNFINGLKQNKDYTYFDNEGFTYFRRKNIEDLYCVCFYGLNDNSFTEKNIDKDGKAHYISRVENEYFTDFSDDISKEDYNKLQESEKPVVLFISNPKKFFEKIREFFIKLGVKENEIIISPVEYVNKKENRISAISYPKELLLKDMFYSKQSEIRIIINSNNLKFLEHMKKNNSIIDIGNIEDITEIYDYYFNDLLIERESKNSILFNLPKPEDEAFEDMDLKKLLDIFIQISTNNLPTPISSEKKEDLINSIKRIIKNKFNIDVDYNNKEIQIYNASDSIFKYFETMSKPYKIINDFENDINKLINQSEFQKAVNEIQKVFENIENKELVNIGQYYMGKISEYKKEYNKAIEYYTYCIDNEIKLQDSLSSRSNCFYRINKYNLALMDLEKLQEKIGYNIQIYTNKGINLLGLGKTNEAIKEFNKSIELNEINPQAYYNRSVAYYRIHDFIKAKNDIYKALQYAPDNNFYLNEYEKFYKNI